MVPSLRIAAYSGLSDATGSVFANVDIPDFARDPVSWAAKTDLMFERMTIH